MSLLPITIREFFILTQKPTCIRKINIHLFIHEESWLKKVVGWMDVLRVLYFYDEWGDEEDSFLDGEIVIRVVVVKIVCCIWLIVDRSR